MQRNFVLVDTKLQLEGLILNTLDAESESFTVHKM